MAENEKRDTNDIHASTTFNGGVRALLSIALYAGIGAVIGHYIGKWGEEAERGSKGLSTLLGRWIGGVTMGSLAGYVSLRGAAEEERKRDDLSEKSAVLEARLKDIEAYHPKGQVQASDAEHHGALSAPVLERAG